MGAPSNNAAQFGPLVAVAAGGPPLDALTELARSMLAGEWRARSDVAQVVACYLACHPWVDVCLAGGEKPGWLRLDVTDADAPTWVMRLEELLAER